MKTRLTVEKLLKNCSGKNQSSMTSIKFANFQVMGTITGKFYQNPLKTVGGDAETSLFLQTDGQTHYYSPLRLTSGDKYSLIGQIEPYWEMEATITELLIARQTTFVMSTSF